MRFDAKTWQEMEKQARNSGWDLAALTPGQVINLWERGSGYNWQQYCRNKSEVHEMHRKLREAPQELTTAELNTVRQWNGVVPATTLAAHGLEGPMGWPSFIDHLERVRDEIAELEKMMVTQTTVQRQRLVITGLHRMDYLPFTGTALTKDRQQVSVLFSEVFLRQQNDIRIGDAFTAIGHVLENSPHAGGNSQFVIVGKQGAIHRNWRR